MAPRGDLRCLRCGRPLDPDDIEGRLGWCDRCGRWVTPEYEDLHSEEDYYL